MAETGYNCIVKYINGFNKNVVHREKAAFECMSISWRRQCNLGVSYVLAISEPQSDLKVHPVHAFHKTYERNSEWQKMFKDILF